METHTQNYAPDIKDPKEDFVSSGNVLRTDKDYSVKDFYFFSNNEFFNKKGQKFNRTAFSGSVYSSSASDFLIGITSLALAPTIGLPRPKIAGSGKSYIVKDEAGGAATTTITIVSQGEETIDGGASTTLTTNYQSKSFYTDGAKWFVY